jgi:hypothetical protein
LKIGLVGCVKTKLPHAAPAAELYASALFRGRRAFVERTCDNWFILSALHGLIRPDAVIEPYDASLADASTVDRRQWSDNVLNALRAELGTLAEHAFEIHAGAAYWNFGLASGLRAAGAAVEIPAEGLGLGRQVAFYNAASANLGARS